MISYITIANFWTVLRIVLTPIIMHYIIEQMWGMVFLLFALAIMTDFLDGFFAKRLNQQTMFGALLDPIADKCLIIGSFNILLSMKLSTLMYWGLWFLIIKELLLLSGAAILYCWYDVFIKPSRLSRIASVGEMFLVLLYSSCFYFELSNIEFILQSSIIVICLISSWLLIRYILFVLRLKGIKA